MMPGLQFPTEKEAIQRLLLDGSNLNFSTCRFQQPFPHNFCSLAIKGKPN
jgi:hypothetical protein